VKIVGALRTYWGVNFRKNDQTKMAAMANITSRVHPGVEPMKLLKKSSVGEVAFTEASFR
jgi:hypothetical protein